MRKPTPRRLITVANAASRGFTVHPGPDLAGFSGAGEGVRTCSADSIATTILGLRA